MSEQQLVSDESIISARGLTKEYDLGAITVQALKGVDLEIKQGDFLSIMGPSGSGKSTLMHLIGCLDTPTSGEILFDGKDVSLLREKQLAFIRNKKIGFVFQQFNLLAGLTVLENVMAPLLYAGVSSRERRVRAEKILDRVGLSDRLTHRPNELSGGQKQRVAIARALVNNPLVLLADEPTGALDTETGNSVLALFREINDEGKTVLLVTHDPEIGEFTSDCIHMRDGRII